ncbi:MAG TPA: LysM domain-containing protein [Mesorhizobium sp.]|jgi:hypothetical protein|nr:LysM domain-containing protein [Mesorhizobium sp.]
MLRRSAALFTGALAFTAIDAHAQQTTCGGQATVEAGETLADVAQRCNVRLGDIFDANPDLQTTEVAAGTVIDMPGVTANGLLDRTRDAIRQAGSEVEDAAKRAGKTVSDYLAENPDLNRDILEFGQRLGVPGIEAPTPERGAALTITPEAGRPGDMVTIQASGLQGDADAVIGAGPPRSEFNVLKNARTSASGRLELSVQVPDLASGQDALVFIVETDRVRLTSKPFDVLSK